jgi:hypothetical protein
MSGPQNRLYTIASNSIQTLYLFVLKAEHIKMQFKYFSSVTLLSYIIFPFVLATPLHSDSLTSLEQLREAGALNCPAPYQGC